jgi:predicted small metal-binding protein
LISFTTLSLLSLLSPLSPSPCLTSLPHLCFCFTGKANTINNFLKNLSEHQDENTLYFEESVAIFVFKEVFNIEKVLRCRDLGGINCQFIARGETVKEILDQATKHVRFAHNMREISRDLLERARAAIHNE